MVCIKYPDVKITNHQLWQIYQNNISLITFQILDKNKVLSAMTIRDAKYSQVRSVNIRNQFPDIET